MVMAAVSEVLARSRLPHPVPEVFAWHERPGAFERLAPPWDVPRVLERRGTIRDGDRLTLEIGVGPVPVRWTLEHFGFRAGERFGDRQVHGPFASWAHEHRFMAAPADQDPGAAGASPGGACLIEDHVTFAVPGGTIGRAVGEGRIVRRLATLFAHRRAQLAADLARHARVRGRGPLTVAVTGASGFIGRPLCAFLATGGHRVLRLVRRPARGEDEITWDPDAGHLDGVRLDGVDAVVHLAGENVAGGRWTEARKRAIRQSRVQGTELLARTLAGLARPPRVLVSASGVGIYDQRSTETLDETAAPASGFLPEVVEAWEHAARPAAERGVRVVHPRFGLILSPEGGALARLLPAFRAGLGGPVGPGTQGMSWIALDDVIGAIHHALFDDGLAGPCNVVGPAPVDNAEFAETLADVLGRPAALPVPSAAIKAAFGEMGATLLLTGARVRPARLLATGFSFRFSSLRDALAAMLGRLPPPAVTQEGRTWRIADLL
jgi:uncharacterized protein (TIGR01777 family)